MSRHSPTNRPVINGPLTRVFGRYASWYLRRNVHALRVLRGFEPNLEALVDQPVIVYLNHPSWWDPLLGITLSRQFFADRRHYVPIHAQALRRYRLFSKLGFFPVERGTRRGASQFLSTAQAVLADWPGNERSAVNQHGPGSRRSKTDAGPMLWVTAQGHFTDPRQRPTRLEVGVSHLAQSLSGGVLVPLAIEYPFWEERYPEALCAFGSPLNIEDHAGLDHASWNQRLAQRLEQTQDRLVLAAIAQEPQRFTPLFRGNAGIGGVYDLWRRTAAAVRGKRFDPSHSEK